MCYAPCQRAQVVQIDVARIAKAIHSLSVPRSHHLDDTICDSRSCRCAPGPGGPGGGAYCASSTDKLFSRSPSRSTSFSRPAIWPWRPVPRHAMTNRLIDLRMVHHLCDLHLIVFTIHQLRYAVSLFRRKMRRHRWPPLPRW